MQVYTIYRATNTINGKVYIGFDSKWPRRKQAHRRESMSPNCHTYATPFHNALRKHGWEAFVWEAIYQSLDKHHTHSVMETFFIVEHHSFICDSACNGYNMTLGGEGQKERPVSEETKQRKSKALKGKPSPASRPVQTPHGRFDGVGMAADALSLNRRTIVARIASSSDNGWYYEDTGKVSAQSTLRGQALEVSIDGICYASVAEAARQLGMPISTVNDRVNSVTLQWRDWVATGSHTKKGRKSISTPHGQFESIAEAAQCLNLTKSTIAARLRSKRAINWQYI